MLRTTRFLLIAATWFGCSPVLAQTVADISGRWRINGNGHPGDLVINQAGNGTLTGTLYGEPMTGYFAGAPGQQRIAVLLRGPQNLPHQAYIATLASGDRTMTGSFYALNTTTSGGSAARNVFGFMATRGTSTTPRYQPPPGAGVGGPADIAGQYEIDGNGFKGPLSITQAQDGTVSGAMYGNDALTGHYASGTGTLAFLRMKNNQPYQVFIGTAHTMPGSAPVRLSGPFYPISPGGGASPQRVQFEWQTLPPPPRTTGAAAVAVPPQVNGDIVRSTQPLDCSDMSVRIFHGSTASHIDVPKGQDGAIRIAQQQAPTPVHAIRGECRDPGRTESFAAWCPAAPILGGNSNVVRVTRSASGSSTLRCVFRPNL